MSQKTVLLLGGGGFVGRSLSRELSRVGREHYLICRNAEFLSEQELEKTYVSSFDNSALLEELLPDCGFVFHLASDTTPGNSACQPVLEATSNLLPSLRLLESLQKYKGITLVYLSTGGAIYGDFDEKLVNEDTFLAPVSYYGASKAAYEKFLIAYAQQTGNRVIILRPSNLYGPGQLYRPGFGIIPTIFYHTIRDKPISIWGEGNAVRDYLYISDFNSCCMRIIDDKSGRMKRFIYNVGAGQGYSLNELIGLIENIVGKKINRNYLSTRSIDVNHIVLDNSKILEDYNWEVLTPLNKGLENTWKWFQNLYKAN